MSGHSARRAALAAGLALLVACGRDANGPTAAAFPASYNLYEVGGAPLPYGVPEAAAPYPGTVVLGQSIWLGKAGDGVATTYLRGRTASSGGRDTSYTERVTLRYTRAGEAVRLQFSGCPDEMLCAALALESVGTLRDGRLELDRGVYPAVAVPHRYQLTLPD